jgi:hypothetical protein
MRRPVVQIQPAALSETFATNTTSVVPLSRVSLEYTEPLTFFAIAFYRRQKKCVQNLS